MSRTDRRTGRNPLDPPESASSQGSSELSGYDTYPKPQALGSARRRVSAAALAKLAERLSQRDRALLDSLLALRMATVAQLQLIHFADHASTTTARRLTRRALNRLHEQRLVHRLDRRIGGIKAGSAGHVYSLAPLGHRLLGISTRKRSTEPSGHHVRHTLAITAVVADLHDAARRHGFELEVIETEPSCWRRHPHGLHPTLKPDLYVQLAAGETELRWFIEIDCATESSRVLNRKLASYTAYWRTRIEQDAHGVFPKVLWIAPDQTRTDFITDLINAGTPNTFGQEIEPRLFAATTANQAIAVLTNFD